MQSLVSYRLGERSQHPEWRVLLTALSVLSLARYHQKPWLVGDSYALRVLAPVCDGALAGIKHLPPQRHTKLWSSAKIEAYRLFDDAVISFDWDSYLVGPVPALQEPWDCLGLHQDPWDIYRKDVLALHGPWETPGAFPINTAICGFRDLALRDQYCDAVLSCARWFEANHPSVDDTQVVVFSEQYIFGSVTSDSSRKILCDRPVIGYSNSIPFFHLWGNKESLTSAGPRKLQAYETALRLKKWFTQEVAENAALRELVDSALSGELSGFDSLTGKRTVLPPDPSRIPQVSVPEQPQWKPWKAPANRLPSCRCHAS